MKSIIAKGKYLLLAVILVALQFSPVILKLEARLTSEVYIFLHYNEKHLEYKRLEFDSHFGEYLVSYQEDGGKRVSFMIKPKHFPFIVSFDPFDESR